MNNDARAATWSAILEVLIPVAVILLDARFGWGEFVALCRQALVIASIRRGAASSQGHNISRIAEETGITRPGVATIINHLSTNPDKPMPVEEGRPRAERVLEGWKTDRRFRNSRGLPDQLSEKRFGALIKKYSGDPDNGAVVKSILLVSGAVARTGTGLYEMNRQSCATPLWNKKALADWATSLRRLCETLEYNIRTPERPRFADSVVVTQLDEVKFRRVILPEIEKAAEAFLDDTRLSLQHALVSSGKPTGPRLRGSVTVLFHEEPEEPATQRSALARSTKARK